MKTCFTAVAIAFCACTVFGGELAEDTKSVLVQPAPSAVTSAPCDTCTQPAEVVCVSGRCQRLYSVEQSANESCRNRLFGGHVVRKNSRTVYRPVRR
jgi:hypothetical protein